MERGRMWAAQAVFVLLLLVFWQWLADTGRIDLGFIGAPKQVGQTLVAWARDGSVFMHIAATLTVMLTGFLLASVIGTALGVLIGLSRTMAEVLEPFLAFLNGMPRLVLQPLIVVVLGFGVAAKVSLVVIVVVVMIIVTTAAAFRDIDENIVLNAKLLGASPWNLAQHVYLPAVAVTVISSARNVLGFALQATLVAEFVGAAEGLGHLITKGQHTFDISSIWAALVVVVAMAIVLDVILSQLERRASHWRPAPV
jgi:NitT/TauT family transport system permease protein